MPSPLSEGSLWLVLVGAVAGWVNTLAGGGSLLTVPALMWYGLPADVANGTSRVAILAQCLAAVVAFRRRRVLDTKLFARVALPSVLGAALGAFAATLIPNAIFKPLLISTLALVALVLLVRSRSTKPADPATDGAPGQKRWVALALFGVGVYGGMFQAGVGIMLLVVLSSGLGLDLVRGNAIKVGVALLYSVVAVWVFAASDRVHLSSGLVLALGNVIGAVLGVRFALRAGQEAVRKVVLVGALAVVLSVLFRQ